MMRDSDWITIKVDLDGEGRVVDMVVRVGSITALIKGAESAIALSLGGEYQVAKLISPPFEKLVEMLKEKPRRRQHEEIVVQT